MKKNLSVFMSATILLSSVAPVVANAETSIKKDGIEYMKRFSGTDRFKTAVDVSKSTFSANTKSLILVNGMNPADALSGGPLAAKLDAPILLTSKDSISQETLDEIARLNPNKVYILGGTGSVTLGVEKAVKSKIKASAEIVRISGKDRFETSVKVAEELVGNDKSAGAGFVNGATNKFPDALSASALLGKKTMPLILTDGSNLPKGAESYNNNSKNYIIGGTSSINISSLSGKRLSGSDRYATSAAVANEAFKASSTSSSENACVVVDGRNYPDALTSISLSKKYDAPILLVDKTLPNVIATYIKSEERERAYIVGGTNSVSIELQNSILKLLEENGGVNAKLKKAKNKLKERMEKLDSMLSLIKKNDINSAEIDSYKELRDKIYNNYVKKEISELNGVTVKELEEKLGELNAKFDKITSLEDSQYNNILAKEIVDGRKRLEDMVHDKTFSEYNSSQKEYYNMLKKADELQVNTGKNKEKLELAYELKNFKLSSEAAETPSVNESIKKATALLDEINKVFTKSPLMLREKEELRYALEEAKKSQSSSNISNLNKKIDSFNNVYGDFKELQSKNDSAKKLIADSKTTIERRFSSSLFKDLTLVSDKESLEKEIEKSVDVLNTFETKQALRNQSDAMRKQIDNLKDKVYLFNVLNDGLDSTMKKVEDAKLDEAKLNKMKENQSVKPIVEAFENAKKEVENLKNDLAKNPTTVSEYVIKNANDNLKDSFEKLKVEYDKASK